MFVAGIQPIIGTDCWVKGDVGFGRLTLIAMNQEGYKNLLELLSLGWLKGQDGDYALLNWEWVDDHAAGLICLTGRQKERLGDWWLPVNMIRLAMFWRNIIQFSLIDLFRIDPGRFAG